MTAVKTYENDINRTQNYFIYRLKKCLIPFGVILLAGILMYILPLAICDETDMQREYYDAAVNLSAVFVIACIAIPVYAFNYKMNKRSADLYYSLPVRREKLFMVHFITGFIAIVAAYTVVFLLGVILVACKAPSSFRPVNQLWMYLVSIPCLFIVYSLYSFIYTRANNVLDGLIFMLFFTFALMLVVLVIEIFGYRLETATVYLEPEDGFEGETYTYSYYVNVVYSECFLPFSPYIELTEYFADRTANYTNNLFALPLKAKTINIITSTALYAALAAAAVWGMVYTEKRNKAENCEQISESPFGYKIMIPLYVTLACLLITRYTGDIWIYTLLMIIAVIGYFATALYKRSLKIGWKAAVILACAIVIGSAAGFIIDAVM